ncbi:hypothetical protein QLL95_gp0212 [Cotonvirus japonicus]|uniref:Uncharacterized protein n=1 Tax=Cotonvirus japonicus TaxID=2811091 RepID=A0ABM7NRB6_9VIRU|nr:hypothetical protein QLL95_gp0212 [Cotonvirus japonicus]BCS82701.1 hypothetical protein [Cotonvirus japonicus]
MFGNNNEIVVLENESSINSQKIKTEMSQRLFDTILLGKENLCKVLMEDESDGDVIKMTKLVFVLTNGGVINSTDLMRLDKFVIDELKKIDAEKWKIRSSYEMTTTIQTFKHGNWIKSEIPIQYYFFCDLADITPIVIEFLVKENPDIRSL